MTNPFVSASVKMFHVTCQPIICSRKNAWALQINKCWLNDPLNSNTYLQTFHMMLQRTRECRKIRKERMQNLFADYQGLLETQGFNVSRAMTLSTFWNSKQKLKASFNGLRTEQELFTNYHKKLFKQVDRKVFFEAWCLKVTWLPYLHLILP